MLKTTRFAIAACALALFPALGLCADATTTATVTAAKGGPTTATATAQPGYAKLIGQWVRPDGGYVLEVIKGEPDGKISAKYYNPSPIKVAQTSATVEGNTTKLYVELRDRGYPGSSYTLQYDPAADQLKGTYYQAMEQQRYEIIFERLK